MLIVTVSEGLSMPVPPFLEIHRAADVLLELVTYAFGMINDIFFLLWQSFSSGHLCLFLLW